MGAQFSKTAEKGETAAEKPGDAAASPSKANGQVKNGHLIRELIYLWCSYGVRILTRSSSGDPQPTNTNYSMFITQRFCQFS